jgi:alkaline phosphatase D
VTASRFARRREGVVGIFMLLVSLTGCVSTSSEGPRQERAISRIAFGSCAHQDKPQPIWDVVLKAEPELFLLLGDNVYGDTLDMTVLRDKYAKLAAQPGFVKLRETCPVLATWDDHDYGQNDAGAEYPMKRESQQLLLDFLGEPAESPRRNQEGVYTARVFGPPGRRVQVILLDTRYFRSPLRQSVTRDPRNGPHAENAAPDATVLGAAQWAWLADQLRQPAELRIIGSSVQVVSQGHGWETWGNFPRERARLLRLIRETRASGVIFLSGDRHMAELSLERGDGAPYPLLDLTSSGLTQTRPTSRPFEENTRRVGPYYNEPNFGLIEVDWSSDDPRVEMKAIGLDGAAKVSHEVRLSELRAPE